MEVFCCFLFGKIPLRVRVWVNSQQSSFLVFWLFIQSLRQRLDELENYGNSPFVAKRFKFSLIFRYLIVFLRLASAQQLFAFFYVYAATRRDLIKYFVFIVYFYTFSLLFFLAVRDPIEEKLSKTSTRARVFNSFDLWWILFIEFVANQQIILVRVTHKTARELLTTFPSFRDKYLTFAERS